MESKECITKVPEDIRLIHSEERLPIGIGTSDGSFDYRQEGQQSLKSVEGSNLKCGQQK